MSIITAIFQAIGQVLTYLFPLSESGHSAIFHDFAGRYTNGCSELTGLIHIGMAIGIAVAFYKVFAKLILEFITTGKEIFTKSFDIKKTNNSRKFFYYTFIPYIFMLVYIIPVGGGNNVFKLLHSYSYDRNLISEGIAFLINAVLLLFASLKLAKNEKGEQLSAPAVLVTSVLAFFAIPVSGLSFCAVVVCMLAIFGINKKIAFRYFISLSVPVLLVRGIIEIAVCVTYINIIGGIIGVVVAGVLAFFVSKFSLYVLKNNWYKYFSYYAFTVGGLGIIIGIIEVAINNR